MLVAVVSLVAAVCGCEAPHDSIQAILKRQAAALEKLPDEDQRRLMPRGEPIDTTPTQAPVLPQDLSLDESRRIALQAAPDIHAAQARIEAALARIGEARATYFPNLALIHNSTRNFQTPESRSPLIRPFPQQGIPSLFTADQQLNITNVFTALTGGMFGTQSYGGSDSNSFSHHSSSLTLAWTLFDGFSREARLMAAKHNYLAAAMALADVQRLLVQAVDMAYLQIFLGREQLRIALADEQFSQEQLSVAEANRDSGKGTEGDVLNFRVRLRAAQANVATARGVLQTGRVLLAELMALPDAQLPDNVDVPSMTEESEQSLTTPDAQEWLERAARNRPDLAQDQHLVNAAGENVRVAKGLFSPALTLSGSYGFENRGNVAYSEVDQASALGVEMAWQLFTGGYRTSQLRRTHGEQREAVARFERTRLAVASDVRRAVVTLGNAQEAVKLQRLALEAALENRRIVIAEYAAGKSSLVRLNEAQRDYVRSDVDLTAARIRLRQAWTDLYAATAGFADGLSWENFTGDPASMSRPASPAPGETTP